jgi:hypothetical protein
VTKRPTGDAIRSIASFRAFSAEVMSGRDSFASAISLISVLSGLVTMMSTSAGMAQEYVI